MELDFSRLEELAAEAAGAARGAAGEGRLQRETDRRQAAREDALAAYRGYQENIARAGMLRAELLQGVRAGEDAGALLVKAAEAISLMTGDAMFYEQIRKDMATRP